MTIRELLCSRRRPVVIAVACSRPAFASTTRPTTTTAAPAETSVSMDCIVRAAHVFATCRRQATALHAAAVGERLPAMARAVSPLRQTLGQIAGMTAVAARIITGANATRRARSDATGTAPLRATIAANPTPVAEPGGRRSKSEVFKSRRRSLRSELIRSGGQVVYVVAPLADGTRFASGCGDIVPQRLQCTGGWRHS